MLDVASSNERDWLVRGFGQRNSLPDRKVYKITDCATEKIVVFTCLTIPYTLTAEQMSVVKDKQPLPQGHNSSLAVEFFEILEVAKKYGYDPKKDYHRKGTMVHPDYQRKGPGSWLTRYCNEVADKTGGKTFAIARPSSKHIFESHEFRVLGSEDLDMTKYGGN
ncbi:hypothetical protein BDZ45DRAFT_723068 [Acephala macrosclerotiorum]|nr:hypothetical protein BDZ45DRAFT_723068 [Acephala macrosclerotiorum]